MTSKTSTGVRPNAPAATSAPLVSILMPTLNSERTLRMALASIRRQTIGRDPVEILIADGGSQDQTRAIALEYGVMVAMAAARGRYALIMGSDEVIANEASFAIKIRLLEENPCVHNVISGGIRNPKGYPPIGHYMNRCGDPFSYFMHRIDMGDHWNALRRRYDVVTEDSDYLIVQIGKNEAFPICDGHFFRLEYLRTIADVSNHAIIADLFQNMAREHRQVAVVKDDFVDHYSTAHYQTAKAKIEWRVVGNLHHPEDGLAGYVNREATQPSNWRWKKYLFIPYALSVAGPAVDAAILAVRCRTPAMLYHVPLTVGTGLSIVKHGALKMLGIKPALKVYGK